MRKVLALNLLGIAAVSSIWIGAASGGANLGVRARLSWVADSASPQSDLVSMPQGTRYLYVQLLDLKELAGCEFELRWYPAGSSFSGCYEFAGGDHPSGSGRNCLWLMRGGQVEGMNEWGEDNWKVAFAGDEPNRVCAAGNVARGLLDFSFCGHDLPGTFCLDYVKVTDPQAVLDRVTVVGDATVLGGVSAQYYPCLNVARSTTWGAIKKMYE